ncbi:ATP-binding protein [Streptomyces sp. NPDC050439]|uniref:ATP-binding protein n=1 Tax=unclassified Streptomyces TaxID=2593676 RepID=UPI0034300370
MLPSTVSPPWTYTLQLPHDPRAPGIARATLRTVLATYGLSELAPTAELLAAEMLNNVHCHTQGPYALRLRHSSPQGVRVAVWDSSPQIPPGFGQSGISPAPAADAENGRGLHLVQACADSWGAYSLGAARGGKLLWAELGGDPPKAQVPPLD